jgi:hypothetical protein
VNRVFGTVNAWSWLGKRFLGCVTQALPDSHIKSTNVSAGERAITEMLPRESGPEEGVSES